MAEPAVHDSGGPVRRPVRLDQLDAEARKQAWTLLLTATRFAASITGYDHPDRGATLANEIGQRMIHGTAKEGLEIQDLCDGRTSEGHVREVFEGDVEVTIDIAVRAVQALLAKPPIHEELFSVVRRTGRDSSAIASDKNPNVARVAPLIGIALGGSDRHLPDVAIPFTTGTRDDHSSSRADPMRIAAFSQELGARLPGRPHEHVLRLLEIEARARKVVVRAAESRPELFAKVGLDPQRFVKSYFPRCLVANPLPYAAPKAQGDSAGDWHHPGDDDDLARVLVEAHKHAVLRCELDEPQTQLPLDGRDDAIDALAERFGERPIDISQDELATVQRKQAAVDLGITWDWKSVRYWWFRESERLVRGVEVVDPRTQAELVELELWRTVQLTDQLEAAVILVEHMQGGWPARCLHRYFAACEPGLMKPHKTRYRSGLLLLSFLANAALVAAERAMHTRRANG
jgi:hypothetical protein